MASVEDRDPDTASSGSFEDRPSEPRERRSEGPSFKNPAFAPGFHHGSRPSREDAGKGSRWNQPSRGRSAGDQGGR